MKAGASIINTSSVTAFKGSPSMVDYSSTKGAIITFTRSLALQLAPKHIRVNVICPGPVFTPLQPASRPSEQMEDFQVGSLPLHGRANQPAEMGPAYGMSSLCSILDAGFLADETSLPGERRLECHDRTVHALGMSLSEPRSSRKNAELTS